MGDSFSRGIKRRRDQEARRRARREMRGEETRLLYHGTTAAHFTSLRDGGWQRPADRQGPYVTDSPKLAYQYAGRAVAAHMELDGSRDARGVVFKLRLPVSAIELDDADPTGRQYIVPAGIAPTAIEGYDFHDYTQLKPGTRRELAASAVAAAGLERTKASSRKVIAELAELIDTGDAPPVGRAIPRPDFLVDAVMTVRRVLGDDAELVGYSPSHGLPHWQRVAANGLRLLQAGEPGDPVVVLLFSILHDAMRATDEPGEPRHGEFGADLARYLNGESVHWLPDSPQPVIFLSDERLELLTRAIEDDDLGTTTTDPTLAVCWDADRLDVWRSGVKPDPRRLSTPTARTHEQSTAALKALGERFDWAAIFAGYADLVEPVDAIAEAA